MTEHRNQPTHRPNRGGTSNHQKTASSLAKSLQPWHFLLGILVGSGAAVLGFYAHITSTAQNAVLEEKFLAKLSARVRPSCIFNSEEAIEADFGASEYIDSNISIKPIPKDFQYEITIRCKKKLAYPPLISGTDAGIIQISSRPVKGNDWLIVMGSGEILPTLLTEGEMDTKILRRFKLEILH